MAKKKIVKESKIHGLVLFKGAPAEEKPDESTYSFESVDQENKIKLSYEFVPFGSAYRYSVLLINESLAPITEIKARIKYPEFLAISRISPPTISITTEPEESGVKQITFEIDELSETSTQQINFYLKPISLDKRGEVNTNLTYVNNKDFVRVLNSDPAEIELVSPVIKPKSIASSKIAKFLKIKGIKKAIKSLGIATKGKKNVDIYYEHIEQLLGTMHKFQLIAKDDKKKISWFFGTDKNSKQDILVIGQIVSNKIEFLAASKDHLVLISLLAILSNEFKKRILSIGKIKSINQIYELECKYCGSVIDRFPAKGESIECKNCNRAQVIW